MANTKRTPVPTEAHPQDPVSIGDALAEVLPKIRRRAPLGATLTIPLSSFNETTLGDLRDLIDLAERLPDETAVSIYVPLDTRDHGTISLIAGAEARA